VQEPIRLRILPLSSSHYCRRPPCLYHPTRLALTWASDFEAEFLEGLRLEDIELELGQRLRRQGLHLLPDLDRQRAEPGFQEPLWRPPLALLNAEFDAALDAAFDAGLNAAFVGGLHEGFNLVIRLGLQ